MKSRYIYAESYGLVWRFSQRKWTSMMRRLVKGEEVRYDDYGSVVCAVDHNITDIDAEFAANQLGVCPICGEIAKYHNEAECREEHEA